MKVIVFALLALTAQYACCQSREAGKMSDSLNVDYPLFIHFTDPKTDYGHPAYVDTVKGLALYLDTSYLNTVQWNIDGNRLYLINNSSSELKLKSISGSPYIYAEALIENEWRPISSIRGDECGNSYYGIVIKAGEFLAFDVPCFKGDLLTVIRYVLLRGNKPFLVSNTIPARINPQQFNTANMSSDQRIFPE